MGGTQSSVATCLGFEDRRLHVHIMTLFSKYYSHVCFFITLAQRKWYLEDFFRLSSVSNHLKSGELFLNSASVQKKMVMFGNGTGPAPFAIRMRRRGLVGVEIKERESAGVQYSSGVILRSKSSWCQYVRLQLTRAARIVQRKLSFRRKLAIRHGQV